MSLSSSGLRVKTSACASAVKVQSGQVGVDHLVDRGAALGGNAGRLEPAVLEPAHRHPGDALLAELAHQGLHVLVGLGAQRLVGLDVEHQVDAAAQVEPEVDLLLGRIGEQDAPHHHDEDGEASPDQAAIHVLTSGSSCSSPAIADFAILSRTLSATLRKMTPPSVETTSP